MKKVPLLVISLLIISCVSNPKTTTLSQAEFANLVKNASLSIQKAQSVGGEWLDSRELLKQAELAAKTGDMKNAEELAKQADMQGKMGYQQALDQKNAGPWLF